MTSDAETGAETPSAARQATGPVALAVTLALQVYTSLTATATAVLAPAIGPDIGVPPKLIGVFVGLVYLGSMFASLGAGGFIGRYGSIRVSQVCVLICAGALALVCGPWWTVALAPLLIGIGYGPITPASSHLLARTTPLDRLALIFSIKQTGVPLGAALAGALMPALALALGWRAALLMIAAAGLLIAAAAQPSRGELDVDRRSDASLSLRGLFTPLKLILRNPRLIELSLTGFFYAATQVCLMSFLVVYVTEALQRPLVWAGFALTVANAGGIVGRIAWGGIADRWIAPRRLLGIIGLVAGACALATAGFEPAHASALLLGVCAVFGASAIGWNGVQLSEVARQAPAGQAGAVTGASGFITFSGVVLGPPAFAAMASLTGSYRVVFVFFGATSVACGLWLLSRRS